MRVIPKFGVVGDKNHELSIHFIYGHQTDGSGFIVNLLVEDKK